MNRITITVGVGGNWHGDPLDPAFVNASLRKIREHLATKFGGYTEEIVHGGWRKNGGVVEEPGRRFIVDADLDAFHADELARLVGRMLQQQAIMLEVETLQDGSGCIAVW